MARSGAKACLRGGGVVPVHTADDIGAKIAPAEKALLATRRARLPLLRLRGRPCRTETSNGRLERHQLAVQRFDANDPLAQLRDLALLCPDGGVAIADLGVQPLNGGERDALRIDKGDGDVVGAEPNAARKSWAMGPRWRTPSSDR